MSAPFPPASLIEFADQKLRELDRLQRRRTLTTTTRQANSRVWRNGRELVSFCCNDYLGLSHDDDVKAAAIAAIREYGGGAGASRLITGDGPLYRALETRLAEMKGLEAALVFGSGFLANVGVISALAGKEDSVIIDELAHASMMLGARLSGAEVRTFGHNDALDAERQLGSARGQRKLLLTETVFSMDGDRAPVSDLADIARVRDAWLMTDDAHGFGVGNAAPNPAPIQLGTLSKAVGSYGGYVCAPQTVVDLLKSRARSVVYTTGLPPSALGASIAALERIKADANLRQAPLRAARRFCEAVGAPPPESAIAPIQVGDETRAMEAQRSLEDTGFLVVAIRPPTVPEGSSRLRVTFTARHENADIDALANAVNQWRTRYVPSGTQA